ncbi:MAG: tRNA-dihydrouridine synthase [Paludibacter sp.]
MNNFWQTINQPIIALAPMEDVTDTVFREVIRSVSQPEALNVLFTEFTSTDGLTNEKGLKHVVHRLAVNDSERELLVATGTKLVAQIWGSDPEKFMKSAQLISALEQFDGIDINMGCPVKKVVKKQCCSALINNPDLAKEIVLATQEGTDLPVSVKTRLGFNAVITEKWIGELLEVHPAAITIHGRTQKMLSTGLAMWDEIGKAVQLRNNLNSNTLILGNGDISSYEMALNKVLEFGVDGVMVGTGVFKNPWMFNKIQPDITVETRLALLTKHINLFDTTWGCKHFNILKRFFKIYVNGFEGAAEGRDKLMHAKSCEEALEVIRQLAIFKQIS